MTARTVGSRAALYARVSTVEQAKAYGLDAQREALRARSTERHYRVVGEFVDDGVSGIRHDRAALTRLRAAVARQAVDRIVCPDVSRMSRDVRLFLELHDEFTAAGVRVEYLNFETDDTTQSRMMLHMLAVFADGERRMIRDRTRAGRMTKAKRRERVGGRVAFGYTLAEPDPRTGKRHLVPLPEEARRLVWMFETYDRGASINELVRELVRQGVRSKHGAGWTAGAVRQMLHNPGYTGTGSYAGLPIDYPPIVARDLYDRVQVKLTENRTARAGRPGDPSFFLKGILRCDKCGRRLAARKVHGGRNRYYECLNVETRCQRRERAGDLEVSVWAVVTELFTDPVRLRQKVEAYERAVAVSDVEGQSAVAHARTVLARASREVERLLDLASNPDLPLDRIQARLATAGARRDAAAESLREAEAQRANNPLPTEAALDQQAQAIARTVRTMRSPQDRAGLLRDLRLRITVQEDGDLIYQGGLLTGLVPPGQSRRVTPSVALPVLGVNSYQPSQYRLAVPRVVEPVRAGRSSGA